MTTEDDFSKAAGPAITLVRTGEFDRGRRTEFVFTYRDRRGAEKTAIIGVKHETPNYAKRAGEQAAAYAGHQRNRR